MKKNSKNFLSSIELVSFKGLRNLSFKGVAQINLILGDNNVGKTSVLESLLVDSNPYKFLNHLRASYADRFSPMRMSFREDIDFVTPFIDVTRKNSKIEIHYSLQGSTTTNKVVISSREVGDLSKDQQAELFQFITRSKTNHPIAVATYNNIEELISQNSPELNSDSFNYVPFIFSKDVYSSDLLSFYSSAILKSKVKKAEFIKALQSFVPDLEDIEISIQGSDSTPVLLMRLNNVDSALPLHMYGDGAIKFFRILLEIAVSADNRLMIDEIDAGMHFTRLKSLWRTTIRSAIQNNTQLFITTHNDECLQFLKEVLEEDEFQSIQSECMCYTLRQLPNKSVKAYAYAFDDFAFAINQQIELRGGVL